MFLGMAVNVEEGAMTTLYVATHPQAPKVDGSYFDACLPVSPSRKATWVIDLIRMMDYVYKNNASWRDVWHNKMQYAIKT